MNRDAAELHDVTSESDLVALAFGHLGALLPGAPWVKDLEVEAVSYWDEALPTYAVGHIRRMKGVADSLAGGGIRLAGDYIGGPHLEGAVLSGAKAIESLAQHWLR